ncbi:hypothetical protein BKA67DRAFT_539279 [Truncatella angustata]|uniref:Uncharacterized protein n=1 Tax=Truncatella angustata TaxID=152316 RepID=A0A9P8RQ98_9PEZI|nr:uncharacterized protein BKA67DRAFT_539279 [Truncatella angustata]KAH6647412.1 hypothetical protein BKA67DRAFT_539279 [Truncatella angustata]
MPVAMVNNQLLSHRAPVKRPSPKKEQWHTNKQTRAIAGFTDRDGGSIGNCIGSLETGPQPGIASRLLSSPTFCVSERSNYLTTTIRHRPATMYHIQTRTTNTNLVAQEARLPINPIVFNPALSGEIATPHTCRRYGNQVTQALQGGREEGRWL